MNTAHDALDFDFLIAAEVVRLGREVQELPYPLPDGSAIFGPGLCTLTTALQEYKREDRKENQ